MKAPHQNVTFEQLIAKVKQAEDLLEARERATSSRYRQLKQAWQEGWTPLRIVSAGLVSGFLVGRAEPLGAVGGARILQMVSAVSSLFASAQASVAAGEAKDAADDAGEVAAGAAEAVGAPLPPADADPAYMAANGSPRRPQAAEAATEMSER
ncbi:protein sip-5 [Pseudoxanthomonas gei]|uniref:Protein sip-5 n=1 Tax=Pseudoxanthomonas gei TaxID=1383030 RepID=A0ABX0ACG5_9GAMM|nr:protein sip-5 [Pseudoxanthomonas gei]NDK37860.1 protein sip-5 [Pseudoxanthomonas gei]